MAPHLAMQQGSAADWREGLWEPCAASSFLTFGLGIGYAGPLLDLLAEEESATFNLYGGSSSGKTLVGRALTSQTGRARTSDLATYGITARGVEELCAASNDLAVVFDEEGRTTGTPRQRREHVRNLAFTIASGRGQIRSERVARQQDLPNLTWRLLGLSSGEKPLEDAGTRRAAGERLRHIDIQVPPPSLGGIFDRVGTEEPVARAIRLAAEVEATIAANYGVALRQYLHWVAVDRDVLRDEMADLVEEIIVAVGAGNDSWERRFARKFGIVAAGAILAAEWKVAPFSPEHARACMIDLYRVARRSVFTVQQATSEVLAQIRTALDDGDRFPFLKKGESLPSGLSEYAWGFRRRLADHGEVVAIIPSKFERIAPSRPASEAILDALFEQSIAIRGTDGKRHLQLEVSGFPRARRPRWICLRASAL